MANDTELWRGILTPISKQQLRQLVADCEELTDFDRHQRQNQLRTEMHPDWPSHKPTLYRPDGTITVFETMPVAKLRHRGYCKYCYKTHCNWWAHDPHESSEYEGQKEPIVLCGECEHNSLLCFTET